MGARGGGRGRGAACSGTHRARQITRCSQRAPLRAGTATAAGASRPVPLTQPFPAPRQIEDTFARYGRLIDCWVARKPGGFGACDRRLRRARWLPCCAAPRRADAVT